MSIRAKVFQIRDENSSNVVTAFPLHALILLLKESFDGLGIKVPSLIIERMACGIHEAMSAPQRRYHVTLHAIEMARVLRADPLAMLAALFHDVVYIQVDRNLPTSFGDCFEGLVLEGQELKLPMGPLGGNQEDWQLLLTVFGFEVGQIINTSQGLNECLSAWVAWRSLAGFLSKDDLIALAVCIEMTIAFRHTDKDPLLPKLAFRLEKLALPQRDACLLRAVSVATADLSNFWSRDPGFFLSQSWNLLMEGNAVFHQSLYSIQDYRQALQKLLQFFKFLTPERVVLPDSKQAEDLRWWVSQNLDIGQRYLSSKLLAVAYVEALMHESGGLAPLALFLGEVPEVGPSIFTLGTEKEKFLKLRPQLEEKDLRVLHLLQFGRTGQKSVLGRNFFDYDHSPLADVLYAYLHHTVYASLSMHADLFFEGKLSPKDFLSLFPEPLNGWMRASLLECAVTRS